MCSVVIVLRNVCLLDWDKRMPCFSKRGGVVDAMKKDDPGMTKTVPITEEGNGKEVCRLADEGKPQVRFCEFVSYFSPPMQYPSFGCTSLLTKS